MSNFETHPVGTRKCIQEVIEVAAHNNEMIRTLKLEVSRLSCEVKRANARERKAFTAGFYSLGADEEQKWQEYRCQDDSDWKAVSEEEASKIDASASEGLAPKE
jgi:hypothetical protein